MLLAKVVKPGEVEERTTVEKLKEKQVQKKVKKQVAHINLLMHYVAFDIEMF